MDIPWLANIHDGYPLSPSPSTYVESRLNAVPNNSGGRGHYSAIWVGSMTFGLLEAAMGIQVPESLLAVDSAEHRVISGSRLAGLIGLWHKFMVNQSQRNPERSLAKGREVMALILNAHLALSEQYTWSLGRIFDQSRPDFFVQCDMIAAIACFASALRSAALSIWEGLLPDLEDHDANLRLPEAKDQYVEAVRFSCKRAMRRAGWCPNAVGDEFLHSFREVKVLFQLFHLPPYIRQDPDEHRDCTDDACKFYTITDTEEYVPRHVVPACTCSFIAPSIDDVEHLLCEGDYGTIPVVVFDGDKLLVQAATDNSYIAFSHVWADGLGSTTDRGLPACQVSRLAAHAASLVPQTRAFWIDSLCVPAATVPRRRAIKLMAQTYKEAASVVVLDKPFQMHFASWRAHFPLMPVRFGMSLALSGWVRRVWTLQEALLARRLRFELEGGSSIDVEEDFRNDNVPYPRLGPEVPRTIRVAALLNDLKGLYGHIPIIVLRIHRVFKDEVPGVDQFTFSDLIASMDRRSITKPEDETLAIASLLSLDTEAFLSITGPDAAARRMRECLLQVGMVPRTLPLAECLKLDLPGFQWAPRSLSYIHTMFDQDRQARCTPEGLVGRYHFVPINSITPVRANRGNDVEPLRDHDSWQHQLSTWSAEDHEGTSSFKVVLHLCNGEPGISVDGLLLLERPSSGANFESRFIIPAKPCVAVSRQQGSEKWESCGGGTGENDPICCVYVGYCDLISVHGASTSAHGASPDIKLGEVRELYVRLA